MSSISATSSDYVRVESHELLDAANTIGLAFGFSGDQKMEESFSGTHAQFRALRLQQQFIAVSRHETQGVWLGSKLVSSAQITHVAVPTHLSGRGHATSLLRQLLADLHNDGIATATLYPNVAALYRSLGFDYAGCYKTYWMRTRDIPRKSGKCIARPIEPAELSKVTQLYSRLSQDRQGALNRDSAWWRSIVDPRRGAEPPLVFTLEHDGRCVGWAITRPRLSLAPGQIEIVDWGCFPEYTGELPLIFKGWSSLAEKMYWVGPDPEPLSWILPNNPVQENGSHLWMLRVVDVANAFTARGWPSNAEGAVEFFLTDKVCPWNNGGWRLTFEKGVAAAKRLRYQPSCQITPRALSPLLTGHTDITTLINTGLVHNATSDERELWQTITAGPKPWSMDRY